MRRAYLEAIYCDERRRPYRYWRAPEVDLQNISRRKSVYFYISIHQDLQSQVVERQRISGVSKDWQRV